MAEFLPGTIGQRLAELREQRGLTREELAERVGISTSTLSRLEGGQIQKFSDEVLTALAQEFGVSTDFLLGLTNIPDRMNYDIGELDLTALAAGVAVQNQILPPWANYCWTRDSGKRRRLPH